ncbi:hypothetical protein Pelo_12001 [Pelomyxa schiedti]|nr:hypothetical protein Pelo_12001 [Pelomyxa schiedti]
MQEKHEEELVNLNQKLPKQEGEGETMGELGRALTFTTQFQSQLKKAAQELILVQGSMSNTKQLLQQVTGKNQELEIHLRDLTTLRETLGKEVEESDMKCKEILGQTLSNSIERCRQLIGYETLVFTSNPATANCHSPSPLQGVRFDKVTQTADEHMVLHKEYLSQVTLGENLHKEIEELLTACQELNKEYHEKYMLKRGLDGDEQFMSHPDVWSNLSELLPHAQQSAMDVMCAKATSAAESLSSFLSTSSTTPFPTISTASTPGSTPFCGNHEDHVIATLPVKASVLALQQPVALSVLCVMRGHATFDSILVGTVSAALSVP